MAGANVDRSIECLDSLMDIRQRQPDEFARKHIQLDRFAYPIQPRWLAQPHGVTTRSMTDTTSVTPHLQPRLLLRSCRGL